MMVFYGSSSNKSIALEAGEEVAPLIQARVILEFGHSPVLRLTTFTKSKYKNAVAVWLEVGLQLGGGNGV